jgi:hypothetical protein
MLFPPESYRLGTLRVIPVRSLCAVITNEPDSNSSPHAVTEKALPGAAGIV